MLLIEDGLNTRSYLSTPGEDLTQENKNGNFVPTRPDSFVAVLVTRKDRVDRAGSRLSTRFRQASTRPACSTTRGRRTTSWHGWCSRCTTIRSTSI
nr:DUF2875 family protein [Burkholderia cepacia]